MPIDRATLEQHLMLAERHVAEGTEHVTRQRELVARLERDGHDVFESKRLLILFEELLDRVEGTHDQRVLIIARPLLGLWTRENRHVGTAFRIGIFDAPLIVPLGDT